jgi:hypothetical protein
MSQFAPFTGRTHALAAAARASDRFVEFFTAQIRNPHTRRAYARAIMRFFGAHGGGIYRAIRSCRPRSRQKGIFGRRADARQQPLEHCQRES